MNKVVFVIGIIAVFAVIASAHKGGHGGKGKGHGAKGGKAGKQGPPHPGICPHLLFSFFDKVTYACGNDSSVARLWDVTEKPAKKMIIKETKVQACPNKPWSQLSADQQAAINTQVAAFAAKMNITSSATPGSCINVDSLVTVLNDATRNFFKHVNANATDVLFKKAFNKALKQYAKVVSVTWMLEHPNPNMTFGGFGGKHGSKDGNGKHGMGKHGHKHSGCGCKDEQKGHKWWKKGHHGKDDGDSDSDSDSSSQSNSSPSDEHRRGGHGGSHGDKHGHGHGKRGGRGDSDSDSDSGSDSNSSSSEHKRGGRGHGKHGHGKGGDKHGHGHGKGHGKGHGGKGHGKGHGKKHGHGDN